MRGLRFAIVLVTFLALGALIGTPAPAQLDSGAFGAAPAEGQVVHATAEFTTPKGEQPARLFVIAEIQPGWHIYSITQAPGGVIPSEIRLQASNKYRLLGQFQASPPPKKHPEPLYNNLILEEHYERVVWHAPIQFAQGVDPATLKIEGSLYAQACQKTCIPPRAHPFTATLGPGVSVPAPQAVPQKKATTPAKPVKSPGEQDTGPTSTDPTPTPQPVETQAGAGDRLPWVSVKTFAEVDRLVEGRLDLEELARNMQERQASQERGGLLWPLTLIVAGFLGGILLNIMPCVLPVIGLKIMSFVSQAGENRFRAFMLNVAFSAGLLSVFLILAVLASAMNLQWGGQFQYPWFNVTMAVVIFAMGLSFLGVWEIPIPGFATSGKAAELAQREGLGGAFAKGIITTLLATPCTGPGMAFAVTTVMSEPPLLIFSVFAAVGLGMASPYLLIGAFPKLIAFLPKPGEWMETFKQVMGFVLLATTVWILSFIHWPYRVPTIGLMFGVWVACWWIQRKATAESRERAWAWIEGLAFTGLVWVLMFPGIYRFSGVYGVMNERWQLATAGAQGATVPPGHYTLMIDFTADWCLNCKYVEANVLDTEAVRELVNKNQVVPVRFDMTVSPEDPDTKEFARILKVAQPSLAILPAKDLNDPAEALRGIYTQASVLERLKQAGPSFDRPRWGG